MTVRIAVIGAGRIGRLHARNIADHPGARLAGVADPDRDTAEFVSAACGSSAIHLDDAFNFDAVLIASPTTTHAEYIERAADAGCAVFCEKPIDLSPMRARACLEAVERASVPLMVGFNRRFDPHFVALKRRLDRGDIGLPETLSITSRDPTPPPREYIDASGGLFRDMTIHDFDMARFLLGEQPVELHAMAACLIDQAIGAAGDIDTAVITLRMPSGRLCQIANSRRSGYGYDQRIEVHGQKGMLRAENVRPTVLEIATERGFMTEPALPFFRERYIAAYRAELDAFICALTRGAMPTPNGQDGLQALLLAEAATQSARTRLPVRPAPL